MIPLLFAMALLAWPARTASRRLMALSGHDRRRFRPPTTNPAFIGVAAAVGGGFTLGIGGAIAGGLAGVVAAKRWRERGRQRDRRRAVADLAETLRSLVSELRAGAHPVVAAETVARDSPPVGAQAMRTIAAAARLGGDVSRTVTEPLLADTIHAWNLAERHGLPLAEVLAAVVRDLDQRTRFARQLHARMAGPRASATVLAYLPLTGVALGEVMGAHPLRVLGHTTLGQVLLVVGVCLLCAGMLWSAKLTHQAALP